MHCLLVTSALWSWSSAHCVQLSNRPYTTLLLNTGRVTPSSMQPRWIFLPSLKWEVAKQSARAGRPVQVRHTVSRVTPTQATVELCSQRPRARSGGRAEKRRGPQRYMYVRGATVVGHLGPRVRVRRPAAAVRTLRAGTLSCRASFFPTAQFVAAVAACPLRLSDG